MRFLHLADLHLGKNLGGYSLIEDQRYVLKQAIDLVKSENLGAVVIAGDIYDSGVPSGEATRLLSSFLTELSRLKAPVLMISGNHDSADKLGFVSDVLANERIYIGTRLNDDHTHPLVPVSLGDTDFYLLPYMTRGYLNSYFTEEIKDGFDDLSSGLRYLFSKLTLNKARKNVLVAHQTVFPSEGKLETGGSEEAVYMDEDGELTGTSPALSLALFSPFDYVALGHIHKKLTLDKKTDRARYPGALLKYHQGECNQEKTFTIVDMNGKVPVITEKGVYPFRDLVQIKGNWDDLVSEDNLRKHKNDYVFFILDGQAKVSEPFPTLKTIYPYALGFKKTEHNADSVAIKRKFSSDISEVDLASLFSSFYKDVKGTEIPEQYASYIKNKIETLKGGK